MSCSTKTANWADHDWCVLHATLIRYGGRGYLLVGESGAGKSTLALRAMKRGASLIADDAVMIHTTPSGKIIGQCLPQNFDLIALGGELYSATALCGKRAVKTASTIDALVVLPRKHRSKAIS